MLTANTESNARVLWEDENGVTHTALLNPSLASKDLKIFKKHGGIFFDCNENIQKWIRNANS